MLPEVSRDWKVHVRAPAQSLITVKLELSRVQSINQSINHLILVTACLWVSSTSGVRVNFGRDRGIQTGTTGLVQYSKERGSHT